jgi:hypothetical protein
LVFTRILYEQARDQQIIENRARVMQVANRLAEAYTHPLELTLQMARLQVEWNRLEKLLTVLWRHCSEA